jgi:GINS complex subunit 2
MAEMVSSESTEMTPFQRCDFAAQETKIEVIPKFSLGQIDLISGTYGPFSPNYPIRVPLWLALYLVETKACNVTPPAELTVAYIEGVIDLEQKDLTSFQQLPFHFFEIARQLLQFCPRDVPDAEEVFKLVNKLEQCRATKTMNNMGFLAQGEFPPQALYVSAFTAPEIESLRATLLMAVNQGNGLHLAAKQAVPAPRRAQRATAPARATTPQRAPGSTVTGDTVTGSPGLTTTQQEPTTDMGSSQVTGTGTGAATVQPLRRRRLRK